MVNKDLVNWLVEAKRRGFTTQLLKKRLLEAGFPEKDVDEAIVSVDGRPSALNKIDLFAKPQMQGPKRQMLPQQAGQIEKQNLGLMKNQEPAKAEIPEKKLFEQKPFEPKPFMNKENQPDKFGRSGFNWMKTAGIIGIVLVVFALVSIILNYIARDYLYSVLFNSTVSLITLFVTILLFFFYYFGFVKMSKKTGERLLGLGSWFIIVPVFLYFIMAIIASLFIYPQYSAFVLGEGGESFKLMFLIIAIIWVVLFFLNVIGQLLFSIGLIKVGKEVKFAKAAGILNIITFVAGLAFIGGIIILVYSILNIFSTDAGGLDLLAGLTAKAMFAVYSVVSLYILWIISTIFGVLSLFDGSKKFEN